MFDSLKKIFKKEPKGEITPSGKAFMNYCQKICDGTWTEKDRISAYEVHITEAEKRFSENFSGILSGEQKRKLIALCFVDTLKQYEN